MGLSFSKSIRFGAVRFNLSGSGIGVSVGIPGLRVGTGPRGAYISGGYGGFRYRKTITPAQKKGSSKAATVDKPQTVDTQLNVVSSVEHDVLSVLELQDSSDDMLLQSINEQRSKLSYAPIVGFGCSALFIFMLFNVETVPAILLPLMLILGPAATLWAVWRDKIRKVTVLFFEPDEKTSDLFEQLCVAASQAKSVRKFKSIATTSRYADPKYSAGASQGLGFGQAKIYLGRAPGIVANIDVPVLVSGRTTIAFYPDRIFAFQGRAVGSIQYQNLIASSDWVKFIEHETVPPDARVIDKTWLYVNKKGGPDRRFKNNRELPVCAYNQFNLATSQGFDVRFLASREGAFDAFASSLGILKQKLN